MHPRTAGAGLKAEKTRAVLALLLTMFFWGNSAVFLRTTALTLTPENALALRYIVLVLMAVPGLLITGQWRIARQHWPRLILTGPGMFGLQLVHDPGLRARRGGPRHGDFHGRADHHRAAVLGGLTRAPVIADLGGAVGIAGW